MKKSFITIPIVLFCFIISYSQSKAPVKFGKVSAEDFVNKVYSVDSNASAVVIADIGSSEIVGNSKGWFSLEFKRYRRVHILNKNGYSEANVEIPIYKDMDAEESLDDLKAVTYNLENGKVVETKLGKDAIFKDKLNKYQSIKKFTFPNVKEGSIIEYQYTIQSDFLFNLQPWEFQGESPVLWSEYNLRLPEFFGYVFLTQGFQQYDINEKKDNATNFTVRDTRTADATESFSFNANVTDYRWVMKNVKALKEESYTSTLRNHLSKLEFQLSDYRYPLKQRNVMGSWEQVTNSLLHSEYFGSTLDKNNSWLSDVVNPLLVGTKDDLERAKKIYAYVRDNITCTSHNARDLDQSLKNVLKTRNGSVAEVNLLLTAMLKYANIHADPVLLSTRSHGYTYAVYPILNKFNYVICDVSIDGKDFFLDATHPRLGFGRLTPDCYNGHARIVNEYATPLELSADSLRESKLSSIMLTTNDKGELEGSMLQQPGYFESHEYREEIKEKGKDEFFKNIKKAYPVDVDLIDPHIDSLDNLDEPIGIKYNFKVNLEKADILYINPMFGEGYKENPFKSAERVYPVEMPYTIDEIYLFTFVIPDGYSVDELPKPMRLKLNEQGDGEFEYIISESNGMISLRSRIKMKRAYYLPEEYDILREFFNLVVKKQNEQIVLKKKK